VDGLFAAQAGWRTVAVLLARLPDDEARQEADAVLRGIPQELRSAEHGVPAGWMADPVRPRRACETAVRTLIAVPASTPSLRLLADHTAKVLDGISDALNGLALLVGAPVSPVPRRHGFRLRVPDWFACRRFEHGLPLGSFSVRLPATTDLSGADVSGAKLRAANLRGARLSGAKLAKADLSLGDLSNVDLSGANLSPTSVSQSQLDKACGNEGTKLRRGSIRVRTREGRERAKARGVKMGRKPKLTDHQKREAIRPHDHGEDTLAEIRRSYNVSGWTISRLSSP
jgi:hypothetical protein